MCLDLFWVSITGYTSPIRHGFFLLKPASVKQAVHNVLVWELIANIKCHIVIDVC